MEWYTVFRRLAGYWTVIGLVKVWGPKEAVQSIAKRYGIRSTTDLFPVPESRLNQKAKPWQRFTVRQLEQIVVP